MPQLVGLLGPGAFRLCSTSGIVRPLLWLWSSWTPRWFEILFVGFENVRDIMADCVLRSPDALFVGLSLIWIRSVAFAPRKVLVPALCPVN